MINGVTCGRCQHILEKPKEPEIALCTSLVAKPTGNGGLPVPWLPGTAWSSAASSNHPGAILPQEGDTWERDTRRRKTWNFL